MSFRFDPKRDLSAEFHRVAVEELDRALLKLNAGDVHQVRTALKRLRALVDLLRYTEGAELVRAQKPRLRAAARALSHARDTEVCLHTLDAMAGDPHFQKAAPERLLRKARQAVGGNDGLAAGNRATALRGLRSIRRALEQWQPCVDWKPVRRALQRSYRKTRRAYRKACKARDRKADSSPDGLHGADEMHLLRKRLKMLWAQLRLVRACHPHAIKGWVRKAERLTELLGCEHDLIILQDRLSRSKQEEAFGPLNAAIDQRRAYLDSRALKLAGPCLTERPRTFIGRVFQAH